MNTTPLNRIRLALLAGCAALALAPSLGAAQTKIAIAFDIPAQDLDSALTRFGQQSDREIIVSAELTRNRRAPAVRGALTPDEALKALLADSGLGYRTSVSGSIVVEATDPQGGSAGGGAEGNAVDALVVTAQKKEEAIQDVPIAISAFSQEALDAQKIEGGPDLLRAIPNVTFSKNNFSGYNFSIRGIGTKAVSVATDPGVSVHFNGTSLIRNRLFEQEYYDIERVEVLRGPQGTLYGRNATAGVINIITAKPTEEFEAQVKVEVGNFQSRRASGFVNIPIAGEELGVRFAGAFTDREGYDYNAITKHRINGRQLWSSRLTVGFEPNERLRGDFIWEHFSEDDDRSRTGKQICTRDPGPTSILTQDNLGAQAAAFMSQGCKNESLYGPDRFGTPNGLSIPFVLAGSDPTYTAIGYTLDGQLRTLLQQGVDPYGGMQQSPDLRTIASIFDPTYRAEADIWALNFDFDLSPFLTLTSQTVYLTDEYYSNQDYNRFNTVPVFNDTSPLYTHPYPEYREPLPPHLNLAPGGIYCDPQLGCSSSIAGMDISRADTEQFSQEFRVQSAYEGRFNFSAGVNYTRYETVEDYFVLFNLISALAQTSSILGNGNANPALCRNNDPPTPVGAPGSEGCLYIDLNPIDSIDGEGHNYFRSSNPYTLTSVAGFGEVYWQATEEVKLILGLRYTDDRKVFTPIPTQLLLSSATFSGGTVDRGYPADPDIKQSWGEFTGRAGLHWTPDLALTDQTMVYATYSRGYKGGGANPPGIGFSKEGAFGNPDLPPIAQTLSYPLTFEPEFVDAFEIGSKNTLFNGTLVLNGAAFFYDYKNYQVSTIKDRTAVNENFDATVWGLELESVWAPTRNLRINMALGWQDSRIADGEQSIDVMDRLQGNDEIYTLLKPQANMPSNCVVEKTYVEQIIIQNRADSGNDPLVDYLGFPTVCPGTIFELFRRWEIPDSAFPNEGAGFFADLSGNKLPNAPHWTQSIGVQYTREFLGEWEATGRVDFYHQSQSWARVYNTRIDKLHGWTNLNVVFTISKPDEGLQFEAYIKNVLDDSPITDAFVNSDDTALTTNIFVLDPRLVGVSLRKAF